MNFDPRVKMRDVKFGAANEDGMTYIQVPEDVLLVRTRACMSMGTVKPANDACDWDTNTMEEALCNPVPNAVAASMPPTAK